jgi:hypothetical protein
LTVYNPVNSPLVFRSATRGKFAYPIWGTLVEDDDSNRRTRLDLV